MKTDYYQMMADYNQWMNRKIYAVCEQIPDAQRKEDRGAFFKSIHGTLNHLLYGDLAWLGRFQDHPIPTVIGPNLYEEFDELQIRREALDQQIIDWTQTLSETWLAQPFRYTSNVDRITRELPTWILVTHMFNHQTHHRGQLTTLLTQMGHDPGVTDIPWLPSLTPTVSQ